MYLFNILIFRQISLLFQVRRQLFIIKTSILKKYVSELDEKFFLDHLGKQEYLVDWGIDVVLKIRKECTKNSWTPKKFKGNAKKGDRGK